MGEKFRVFNFVALLLFVCACNKDNSGNKSDVKGYEFVDLGLSVKWATKNLGAAKETDMGKYYAWGETKPKTNFTKENYLLMTLIEFQEGNIISVYTKYRMKDRYLSDLKNPEDEVYSRADNLSRLEPCDDAATVSLGDGWQIPTTAQWKELLRCKIETEYINRQFYVKVTGPNGKFILFPYQGRFGNSQTDNNPGQYWSSQLDEYLHDDKQGAVAYLSGASGLIMQWGNREDGYPIRAVYTK